MLTALIRRRWRLLLGAALLVVAILAIAPHRPELLHPFASAIDSPELKNPETLVRVHIPLQSFLRTDWFLKTRRSSWQIHAHKDMSFEGFQA